MVLVTPSYSSGFRVSRKALLFLKNYLFIYYVIHFWLRWVFAALRGLALVVASGDCSLWWASSSSSRLPLLQSMGSRARRLQQLQPVGSRAQSQ